MQGYPYGMGAAAATPAPGVNNPVLPQGVGDDPNVIATDWYSYSCFVTDLAAAASTTTSIQIEADSDFMIEKLTQYTLTTLAEVPQFAGSSYVPDVTIMLIDTGSGRQLMNIPLPAFNIFGTAQLPFVLPKPRRLFARSTLSVQVANLNTSQSYAYIYLTFTGRKIFTRG